MEKIYQWKKYVLYACIGFGSGVVSSYGIGGGNGVVFYKPPLVFFIANLIILYDVFLKSASKALLLLLAFFAIYLSVAFTVGLILPVAMPLGGVLTLLSYRLIGIEFNTRTILISTIALFVSAIIYWLLAFGASPEYLNGKTGCFINFISIWQVIVFTTVAISMHKQRVELLQDKKSTITESWKSD